MLFDGVVFEGLVVVVVLVVFYVVNLVIVWV